ncbi:thioesterase family protein [Ophiostoma piceae UAMH 11346]|uniref:Thioesterase family protein n=1 Tax=Ophiostoma piceae (strain UAMH 11346) TaxID=1262450 RepID=S3BPH4_OPHP1|nr:thioesterase family protein [Ophiostoma piceae UAMH 11346]
MVQSHSLQEAIDHFRKEEWCAALIDAPGVKSIMPSARRSKSASRAESEDELFRTSLNNDNAVPQMLFIYQEPEEAKEAAPSAEKEASLKLSIMSASLIMDLREGVKGFNSFAHGGFLAAAMDEAMGGLIFTNYEYQRDLEDAAVKNGGHWEPPAGVLNMNQGVRIVTASMNTRFRRPVSLPSFVVTTATISRLDGRKIYLDVEVRDARAQAKNEACATCEGMWMTMAAPPAKSRI